MKVKIFVLSIIAVLLSGCVAVDTVRLEVLRPPQDSDIIMPESISLTNGYLSQNQKTKDDFKNLVAYDKYRLDSLVSVEALRSVYEVIERGQMVKIQTFDSLGKRQNLRGTILELSGVDIVSEVETEPVYVNSRGAYYAAIMVPYKVKWKIVENKNNIKEKVYHDTVWSEGYKRNFDKLADLVRFNDVIEYIIDKTAVEFARQISPTWQEVKRYYYRSGNNDFQRAAYFMDNEQYDKAAEIWEQYTKVSNKSLAGNAYINLAVYHELKGEIDKAIEYALLAKDKENDLATRYLQVLQKRKQEIIRLLQK